MVCLWQGIAWIGLSWTAYDWITRAELGRNFDCEGGRLALITLLGGAIPSPLLGSDDIPLPAKLAFEAVAAAILVWQGCVMLFGAWWWKFRKQATFSKALCEWGSTSSGWLAGLGSWSLIWTLLSLAQMQRLADWWSITPEFWCALMLAGLTTSIITSGVSSTAIPEPTRKAADCVPWGVWTGISISTLVWGVLNTALWFALLVPHGDSAMYEEHLWNLLHGKGFRSYIDKGLFWGEHIQCVHLGLIPMYVLWPQHLLLEWCQSLGLALGAWPVYTLAREKTGDQRAATCLALAYLLFFPMQRLDISLDFKTFRPEAFGIPLLLATLWSGEQRRWGWLTLWGLLTLSVKEDYALVFGPLGVWLVGRWWWNRAGGTVTGQSKVSLRGDLWWGIGLTIGSVAYLWWSVKFAIPYFKAGNEVHYSRYFPALGNSINEILWNLLTRPDIWMPEVFRVENGVFLTALLVPLGGLALLSPSRLLVGLPLFLMLSLNSIARNPQHHFHAPLVAILFWAAAAGLVPSPTARRYATWVKTLFSRGSSAGSNAEPESRFSPRQLAVWGLSCAFWTGVFHSFGPLGCPFWDPLSGAYWEKKYLLTERARRVAAVLQQIPASARVASTDFIHPRFNHHLRSYDYSGYRPVPPSDTEYLVIDVQGPYANYRTPWDVAEYAAHPEQWELLPDTTNGYFWIFRRRDSVK